MYFFYVDLLMDFLKLISYMIFFGIVVHYYGIPLHIVRDVYMTLRSFLQRCRDLVRYRQATANMQERYPTATQEELDATDGVCIVCREEMHLGTNDQPLSIPETPKKLPCGHIFHFRCLRSWLERQQSCPTCRRSVLQDPPLPPQVQGPGPLPNPPFPNQDNDGMNRGPQDPLPPHPVPPVAGPHPGFNPRPNPNPVPIVNPNPIPITPNPAVPVPNVVYPIILTPLQAANPVQVLDGLSDDQLQRLQGNSRTEIISRLEALNGIQKQLVGVSNQLQQLLSTFPEEDEAIA
jgi:E3 ubiquitin-protein ligase synoviolin